MPIETVCAGCERQLKVADEHAGKQARCPVCGTLVDVPETAPPLAAAEQWYMRTPEGQSYGPIGRTVLEEWVQQGRISSECSLRRGDRDDWLSAADEFPALGPVLPAATQPGNPAYGRSGTTGAATSTPAGVSATPSAVAGNRYVVTDRGVMILTLAIIGWIMCPLFSLAAWMMGTNDLREIREGRMDPSARGLTQAGMMLGMIQCLFSLVAIVIGIFTLLLVAAFNN